jgi:GNAT superfamily N-acetyltransferase
MAESGVRPVLVRDADAADLPALLRLYGQLGGPDALPGLDTAARALAAIGAQPGMRLLVAEQGGQVAGTVTLVVVPNITHFAKPWAQVENMVVEETHRTKGVGRLLLDRCMELAREAGCYKVQLQSANQRDGAHRFYERYGFAPSSVGFRLYLE